MAGHPGVNITLTRRTFVRGMVVVGAAGAGASAVGALAGCDAVGGKAGSGIGTQHARKDQPAPRGYDGEPRELPIPELYQGTKDGDTRRFELELMEGNAEILPGVTTKTWGFNGPYLGPTLMAKKREHVSFTLKNSLPEMTTVHWHGMKLPAKADGGPHLPIEPGGTWDPEWNIEQPAASVWYHPHPHERTALHAYRGLAGLFVLSDEVAENLDVPSDYGVDDIPLAIVDAKFTDDGQLDEEVDETLGLQGTTPVVNGIANAYFQATTRRIRLRVLNGASMRFYTLALDDASPLTAIATDSGLLDKPHEVDDILIGPGERVEFLVDLEPGKTVNLQSMPRKDNFGIPADEGAVDFGFRDHFQLLEIRGPEESAPEPGALPDVLDPAAAADLDLDGVKERKFILDTFSINGQMMDMARVDEVIDKDAPEIWEVTNDNNDWPHNFHIHDARFKVLSLEPGEGTDEVVVPTYGWKDTVALPPKATARLAVDLGYYPDPKVPYMYHCHMLLHEDSGMMGQFVIVGPGEKPDVYVPPEAHAGHGKTTPGEAGAAGHGHSTGARGNPGGFQDNLDAR